ncbi:MAG: 16S rRNA (guanine(527)-N(7))-methyltransferase RsmG [Fimbriimonadales bacterium]|nr:16S rRNA (guanine(527)-N(7))-methyltransferase RsmG [Fimbriimonadales bacterium]
MNGAALSENAAALGVQLTRVQLEAFALFEKFLYEANATMNLTRVPQDECWSRHFLDSLAISPMIPKGSNVLDIGSGPGFPGACLAIARSDLRVTCIDSSNKAVSFMARVFGPNSTLPVLYQVINARAETAAHDSKLRESFDVVTGRAIAPFPVQAEISAAFVKVGGIFVPMRTPKERDEIAKFPAMRLGLHLSEFKSVRVAALGADRLFPNFAKKGKTPGEYPRGWSKIKASPLS